MDHVRAVSVVEAKLTELGSQCCPVEAEEFGGGRAVAAGVSECLAKERGLDEPHGTVVEVGFGQSAEGGAGRRGPVFDGGVQVVADGTERPGSVGDDVGRREVLRPQRPAAGDHGGVLDGCPKSADVLRPVAVRERCEKLGRQSGHDRCPRGGGMTGEK
jgi:hypothetical protein